ncbi:MAG TPA: hypothetical protein VFM24_05735 [Nitrospira sp.]|nr:hypothetical protein [Nitrospira sp.]
MRKGKPEGVARYTTIALASALAWCAGEGVICAEGHAVARIGPSGEFVELEHSSDGRIVKNYLPLHHSGNIRYFSAGVGLEERQAEYPAFSLKLVFTAGGKPYLTGVEVAIQPRKGDSAVSISKEHIEAPWLFVDLPAGVYDIIAVYGTEKRSATGVTIVPGKQKTLYLRWSEDAGAAVHAPAE